MILMKAGGVGFGAMREENLLLKVAFLRIGSDVGYRSLPHFRRCKDRRRRVLIPSGQNSIYEMSMISPTAVYKDLLNAGTEGFLITFLLTFISRFQ